MSAGNAGTATPESTGVIDKQAIQAAVEQERERASQIRQIAKDNDVGMDVAERLISNGVGVNDAKAAMLDHIREQARAKPTVQVGATRELEQEKLFGSLGEQLQAIWEVGPQGSAGVPDPKLLELQSRYAAATGAASNVPSDAGFIIQADLMPGITSKMWSEGQVLSRVNRVPISGNSNRLVRNHFKEHSRQDGSRYGGVRVYRREEAGTVEASRPKLRKQTIELESLMGIFYATEEVLQDARALTVEAERMFRKELIFVAENEIFRGTGAAECFGILNSAALVTESEDTSQAADTFTVGNAARMLSRLPASSIPTAAWFIHQFVIPQLVQMKIGDTPVFIPGGNVSGAGFGTLFGVPIVICEYCNELGTLGDVCLFDMQQYTAIAKEDSRWQESIHVRFLYDERAFKLTYRFNGQPDWDAAVTTRDGNGTISPYVVLENRTG